MPTQCPPGWFYFEVFFHVVVFEEAFDLFVFELGLKLNHLPFIVKSVDVDCFL